MPECGRTKSVTPRRRCFWEDHSVKLDVTGGWHDAGDYGKYVTAAAAALAHLLYAWKMFPEAFRRQDLNIPGKPSNMPDILIECRWELEWLLKMQRFDGAVWHKATTAKHAAFVMPEDDREQMYVLPSPPALPPTLRLSLRWLPGSTASSTRRSPAGC